MGTLEKEFVVVIVQLLGCVQLLATPQPAARQASLSFTISQNLLKFMSIESVMPFYHLILCHLLLLLPSVFPSIRVFSNELAVLIRWPNYWSFSFNIGPSNVYSGLISLGLTGLISLLSKGLSKVLFNTTVQKHQFSAFFMVQLLHPYMTTGKTMALIIRTFISKVMSLLFNTVSRFFIAFLPRSKCLYILWLQSPYAVILEPKKVYPCIHCSPIYFP